MKDNTPKNDKLRQFDKNAREGFNSLPNEKKEKSLNAKSFILYPFELFFNQSKTFEEKEADSLELIYNHLITFKRTFVATSWGMDSVVMADLVLRAWKKAVADGYDIPKPDFFLNDTLNTFKEEKAYWKDIVKYLDIEDNVKIFTPPVDKKTGKQQTVWTIAKKFGHLPAFRASQKSKKDLKGARGHTPECCNILKKASLKIFLKAIAEEDRYDCHFIGTRAEESRMRAMSLLQRCRTYLITSMFPYPIRACTPLGYWKMVDTYEYYHRYNIPKNPAYKAHDMERMGCASCPAHINWEIRLAKDPTNEGFGMLRQNFKILKETVFNGTENQDRLIKSVNTLVKYLSSAESDSLTPEQRERIEGLIEEFKSS